MKKLFSILITINLLAFLALPLTVGAVGEEQLPNCCKLQRNITIQSDAATTGECPTEPGQTCTITGCTTRASSYWGMFCLLNTLYNITNWVFVILVALAAIFVIVGAMNILWSGGNQERVTSGRNYILYAMVGLLLAFLAKAVPGVVKLISGF